MPRSKQSKSIPAELSCQLVVNFGDDATQWFRELSAAVASRPAEIEVQFVGGCAAPPHEIVALRNALLRLPRSIRLVTTALVSLPPMTCVAWLAGDERRISKDAVLWIPDLPEDILRGGLRRGPHSAMDGGKNKAGKGDFEMEAEDSASEDEGDEAPPFGRPKGTMGRKRCERDLREISDVLNEWFPCWEFRGGCLSIDDLVVWGVVKEEWCFGGRGVRNRDVEVTPKKRTRSAKTRSHASSGGRTANQIEAAERATSEVDKNGAVPQDNSVEATGATCENQCSPEPSDL
jgi:hypothetical protein